MSSEFNELFPTKARLDICTLCQLDCKDCFMRLHNSCAQGAGCMKFDDFAAFLALNPHIKKVELSRSGEIFLHPELLKIIEYSFANGVKLTARNGVNLNNATPEILEALVKYQFEDIVVSIDGWDQESYVQYRRGGNFDQVIANIKLLNGFKKEYLSKKPALSWKYIILPHNDNLEGAERAKQTASELEMDFYFAKDWGGYIPKNIKSETPVFTGWNIPCSQLWLDPQINWDGRFFGCCVNSDHSFDNENLFKVPLSEYLGRKVIKNTKSLLMGANTALGTNKKCEACPFYKNMLSKNCFISENELRSGGRIVEA